jgi:hypothetical protein
VPRNTTTTAAPADALADVLRAVQDPDARAWLQALLVRGEGAVLAAGGRPNKPRDGKAAEAETTRARRARATADVQTD